jgi:hypothetical protein
MSARKLTGPLPAIFALGEAAEVAAYELAHGAMDPCRSVHHEVVEAVHALPDDLSALPPYLAKVLAGLRKMGDWDAEQVRPRILARCPLAAVAHDMTYPMERVKPITDFAKQIEVERLLFKFKNFVEGEGVNHPETVRCCRTLLAALEPSHALDFGRVPKCEPILK